MLPVIALLGIGFVSGVLLTAMVALYVFGLLRAYTTEIIDQHVGVWLYNHPVKQPVPVRSGRKAA
ncbi:MAG: hypothetical protein P0Y59_10810 [Candidatus Sphingomonas phytovorans]|nr:hypothetical protein [Sphingomonas sp.]WEK02137.1 MAG: hypothetical protein P0Y59_10810 [Sphingomonas sp.]